MELPWIYIILFLYLSYYTFKYARMIWKEGNKLAGICTAFLAISLLALPIYLKIIGR